jgi:hypothetical protein
MNFLKLSKTKINTYSVEKYNSDKLPLLAYFLTDDVQCGWSESWKELIHNLKDDESTGGNISFLDRVGENIIIGDSLAEDRYAITYTITIKNLLEVLDQWEQLCKEKPQEIWIFEENGKVWLEGKN